MLQTIIHGTHVPQGEEVPVAPRAVVEKALEKDPVKRYQSMGDMVLDLRRLLRQSVAATPQLPARRIRWAAAVVLIAVALIAGSALIRSRLQRPPVPRRLEYTQLTNFADSATSPALSPAHCTDLPGPRMASGCISRPISVTDITSGGSASRMGLPSRLPPASRKKRGSNSLATAATGGSVTAPVLAAGRTQLHVRIPDGAITGNVTVTVGGATSNAVLYRSPF